MQKLKAEERLARKLAVDRKELATEVQPSPQHNTHSAGFELVCGRQVYCYSVPPKAMFKSI